MISKDIFPKSVFATARKMDCEYPPARVNTHCGIHYDCKRHIDLGMTANELGNANATTMATIYAHQITVA